MLHLKSIRTNTDVMNNHQPELMKNMKSQAAFDFCKNPSNKNAKFTLYTECLHKLILSTPLPIQA